MYCIYRITNNVNSHTYIGQHKYTDESNPMKGYRGSGKLLKLAYKKYGIENFTTEILYSRIRDKKLGLVISWNEYQAYKARQRKEEMTY